MLLETPFGRQHQQQNNQSVNQLPSSPSPNSFNNHQPANPSKMRFFTTELVCLASALLAPALAAPAPAAEGTVSMQFARDLASAAVAARGVAEPEHKLVRRACKGVYESMAKCIQGEGAKCLHCSSEPPKESLTCLNSCFSDNTSFCAELCP